MENVSKSGIMYCEAERLALSIGAVSAGVSFYPKSKEPCSTHFFNSLGREVGYFQHTMESFNDTRELGSDKQGRVWCENMRSNLAPVELVKPVEMAAHKAEPWDLDRNGLSVDAKRHLAAIGSTAHPKFKVGQRVKFYTGFNDDILAIATIKAINGDDLYVYSDCYWFPIQDDKRRKIELVKE